MTNPNVPGHDKQKDQGTPSKVPGQSNQPLHPGQHPKDGQGDDDVNTGTE